MKDHKKVLVELVAEHMLIEILRTKNLVELVSDGVEGVNHISVLSLLRYIHQNDLVRSDEIREAMVGLIMHPGVKIIQFRTKWSSGRSEWMIKEYCDGWGPESIKEELSEIHDREYSWSDNYRGVEWEDITEETLEAFLP